MQRSAFRINGPWIALLVCGLFQPAAAEPLPSADRHLVFAHYMVCFTNSVEFYKREIELAQRHGIDGFALNCGEWYDIDTKTGERRPSRYVAAGQRLYQAAQELGTGFRLFFSADVNGLRDLPVNMGDMVSQFYDHPNQFRVGDRRVVSAWAGNPETFRAAIDAMKTAGRQVCFVPFMYPPKYSMAWSPRSAASFFDGHPHIDGIFYFACDDSVNGAIRSNAVGRQVTAERDKIYMAGASPAYNSPNLRDFRGLAGYAAMWRGLIRDDADWVELVTWNDYQEDSALMPFRWPAGQDKQYFDRDESYLDLTGYYSAWFKSGRPPKIPQDRVYLTHRARSKWQTRVWDEKKKEWADIRFTAHPFDQMHDDVEDNVYCTTLLTAPATLTLRVGGTTKTFEQPAGLSLAELPLAAGVPQVELSRGGKTLLAFDSRKTVIAEPTEQNSIRGAHLANRTWTSGDVVGPAVIRLEAEAGATEAGATVEKIGDVTAVRTVLEDGSGFRVPVSGLVTSTYAVRIRYTNPGGTEARLTLESDGPAREEKAPPYLIPLFLPATKEAEFKTVSFLWSLYETTSHLQVVWRQGRSWNKIDPAQDDIGSAAVDWIELVRVQPFDRSTRRDDVFPAMVPIPGGAFTMGAAAASGDPDEMPQAKVTLSPFAMSRHEITNAQFEAFRPEHRTLRDGFSWRPGEPVVYVSWKDGAEYCNWLSQQAGLKPAYAEVEREVAAGGGTQKVRNWETDMAADGFRMPTEAEWEYVASGRGEGRRYPWGDAEPVPGVHGNFVGRDSLRIDPALRSTPAVGVMEVGSYPAGASRDGVLDLAGNVCEWCSDWFGLYTAEAKTNPCHAVPGNYRSIRGSSWDYYGWPLRNTDREFNNQNYPGYVYLGLRVVLPEAGWKKIKDRLPAD